MRSCEENRGWNGRALLKHLAVVADLGAGAMLSFHGQHFGALNTGTPSDIGVLEARSVGCTLKSAEAWVA